MTRIRITNTSFNDKDYLKTFYLSPEGVYKMFSVNSDNSTLVPNFLEWLKPAIGDKIFERFHDYKLSESQTKTIKEIFEKKTESMIPLIETAQPLHRKIIWNSKEYFINIGLTSPNNRMLKDFYTIFTIAKECLDEAKPMFLSIVD